MSDEDDARQVYCDWLEENGRTRELEALALEREMRGPDGRLLQEEVRRLGYRFRRLVSELPPEWCAAILKPTPATTDDDTSRFAAIERVHTVRTLLAALNVAPPEAFEPLPGVLSIDSLWIGYEFDAGSEEVATQIDEIADRTVKDVSLELAARDELDAWLVTHGRGENWTIEVSDDGAYWATWSRLVHHSKMPADFELRAAAFLQELIARVRTTAYEEWTDFASLPPKGSGIHVLGPATGEDFWFRFEPMLHADRVMPALGLDRRLTARLSPEWRVEVELEYPNPRWLAGIDYVRGLCIRRD